ncbi:ATP-binding protein [Paenibacillus turicensis]|uniref:ATP-binding protein n=1 Tax=Paenibacillus turicensis TaxID=160487 RepID=UPI003D2D4F50
MDLKTINNPFGKIISVSGMDITIEVDDKLRLNNLEQEIVLSDETVSLYVGTVGDIFVIGGPSTSDSIHYGIFEEVRLVSESEKNHETKAVIIAKVIGYQDPRVKATLQFKRGIGHYPKFNSLCYLLTVEEKQQLFSLSSDGLSIGSATGFADEVVRIHTNKFLSKHSVILGSTGSGKSYTVASILQKVLKEHPFSHIVFFDLHDEYYSAFSGDEYQINKIEASKFCLPYWILNFEEFQSIFLGDIDYTKNTEEFRALREQITKLKEEEFEKIKKGIGTVERININSPMYFSFESLVKTLERLNKQTFWKSDGVEAINEENGQFLSNSGSSKVDRKDKDKDQVLQGPYFNKLTQIIDKLKSINLDRRYQFLFSSNDENSLFLVEYITQLLSIHKDNLNTQLTILDFSKIPSEITPIIIGMIARISFEYKLWDNDPKKLPIYLVFEEAHNYIPRESTQLTKLPQKYIGRIAKEGRKYGISQLIISQRPSDLSTTIISQCSNFFVLRVTNPDDQSFVQHVLPDHLGALSSMIPFFENGEVLVAGECIVIPTKVIIDLPKPLPNSSDVQFTTAWKKELEDYNVLDTIKNWWEVSSNE